ncbi:MAG: OmpA family protein [Limisphaerales bacterium]
MAAEEDKEAELPEPKEIEFELDATGELGRLQDILSVPEVKRLRSRLDDPDVRAKEISDVIPQALTLSGTNEDNQLARALKPTLAKSIEESARENPQVLADAIFPVLGPAIRKSIQDSFQLMVQRLQMTLDYATTAKGWKWRLEAMRTGRSFAEVVLYHTLVYRVEQVFLIQKEKGLLLQHLSAPSVEVRDGDMISGMLTAITDFVKDSFDSKEGDELNSLNLGDLTVWIESGPKASLAVVVRGNAPFGLRKTMQEQIEAIHREFEKQLYDFKGETVYFDPARPRLEACLQSKFSEGESGPIGPPKSAYVMLAVIILLLVGFFAWRWYHNSRWEAYFDALRATEGITLTEVDKRWGVYHVQGLRDPLADHPLALLRARDLDEEKFKDKWEPYVALTPMMVERRAANGLKAPPSVQFKLISGELTVTGEAAETWVSEQLPLASVIPGVREVNSKGLRVVRAENSTPAERIRTTTLLFDRGRELIPGQEEGWAILLRSVREHVSNSDDLIWIIGESSFLDFGGQSDTEADVVAELVKRNLAQNGIPEVRMKVDAKRAQAEFTLRNSRVTFRVDDSTGR